jgi:hypothetical protein
MAARLGRDFGDDVWVTTNGTSWSFTGLGGDGSWTLARMGSGGPSSVTSTGRPTFVLELQG